MLLEMTGFLERLITIFTVMLPRRITGDHMFSRGTAVLGIIVIIIIGCPENISYCKCSKILNTFLFQFSNKMLFIREMLARIANR